LVLSEGIKTFFFAVIVFVNLIFFVYWVFKMYQEMKQMILLKYGKVYLVFCLCFNKNKLDL